MNDELTASASRLMFPVELVPLKKLTGKHSNGLQAVLRSDTDQVIAVHGRDYRLVRNDEVFPEVDALVDDLFDTANMTITDQITANSGKSLRTYRLPSHTVEPAKGDAVEMQVVVMNSYDGSSALRIHTGGLRLVCMNGMVLGDQASKFRAMHRSHFDHQAVIPRIRAATANFMAMEKEWALWTKRQVNEVEAEKVLVAVAAGSEKLLDELRCLWKMDARQGGANLWTLYNTVTYWSTHWGVKAENRTNVVLNREARVAGLLANNPLFHPAADSKLVAIS